MDDWRSLTLNVINENERYNDDKFLMRLRSRNDIFLEASQTYGGKNRVERRLLANLAELFNKRNKVHIPEKLEILLFMEVCIEASFDPQSEVEFSDKEVAFLESLKGVYEFTLLTPANLKVTEKQAERIKQLLLLATRSSLDFGYPLSLKRPLAGIDINEDFLQKLIDRKAEAFRTNAVSDVTPEFLLKYIRNCLAGSYALQRLGLILSRTISESDLLSLGFEVGFKTGMYFGRREIDCHKHKKGKWPSDIWVRWGSN